MLKVHHKNYSND